MSVPTLLLMGTIKLIYTDINNHGMGRFLFFYTWGINTCNNNSLKKILKYDKQDPKFNNCGIKHHFLHTALMVHMSLWCDRKILGFPYLSKSQRSYSQFPSHSPPHELLETIKKWIHQRYSQCTSRHQALWRSLNKEKSAFPGAASSFILVIAEVISQLPQFSEQSLYNTETIGRCDPVYPHRSIHRPRFFFSLKYHLQDYLISLLKGTCVFKLNSLAYLLELF